jgi:hypothetical protein
MSLERGIEVLEGALGIGRQADPIALPIVEERMSTAREKVSCATPKAKKPLLAKGSWPLADGQLSGGGDAKPDCRSRTLKRIRPARPQKTAPVRISAASYDEYCPNAQAIDALRQEEMNR